MQMQAGGISLYLCKKRQVFRTKKGRTLYKILPLDTRLVEDVYPGAAYWFWEAIFL